MLGLPAVVEQSADTAGFRVGLERYHRGDFATPPREWCPHV